MINIFFFCYKTDVQEFKNEDDQVVREEIKLDYNKEVEVIRFQNTGAATDGGVLVLDFKRVSIHM